MDLELRHLKLLAVLREGGSLASAGRRLHLTPSALSHQLKEAERVAGTALFVRSPRGLTPTAAGRRLIRSAEAILEETRRVGREIRSMSARTAGVLRVSTECYTCYHWLPGTLEAFQQQYPDVEVRVVVEATRHPEEALLAGIIDLGIVSDPIRSRRIRLRPLFSDEVMAVLAPSHDLASRRFVEARDLAQENLYTYAYPQEGFDVFTQVMWPAGLKPKTWIPLPLTSAIVEMVAAGLGVGALAKWAIAPELESGRLVSRPLTRRGIPRRWSAAVLRQRREPSYVEGFIRAITSAPRHAVVGGTLAAVSRDSGPFDATPAAMMR